jgi:hypothetical protein
VEKMSIYVAIYRKNVRTAFPEQSEFHDYLPYPAISFASTEYMHACLYVWQWGTVFDRKIRNLGGSSLYVQGYATEGAEDALAKAMPLPGYFSRDIVTTSCTAVLLNNDRLTCYSSMCGCELAYFRETADFLIVSNRIGPLSFFGSLGFRKEGLAQLAGIGYLTDGGTLFEGVRKICCGERFCVNSGRLTVESPRYSELWPAYDMRETLAIFDQGLEAYAAMPLSINQGNLLSLSGGKDSRGVLSLLEQVGGVNERLLVRTSGPPYSPEVLAARNVMSFYADRRPRHVIQKIVEGDLSSCYGDFIANCLYTAEGNCGLSFSLTSSLSPQSRRLQWRGHEIGMKMKPNYLTYAQFLESARNIINGVKFLNQNFEDALHAAHCDMLERVLENVPLKKYSFVSRIFWRINGWAAFSIAKNNITRAEINPFLDLMVIKALAGSPPEFSASQLGLYHVMSRSQFPLASQPFCDDTWPPALIPVLKKLGIHYDTKLMNVRPFSFHPEFPTEKRKGSYDFREAIIISMRNYIKQYITKNFSNFDFLDMPFFISVLDKKYTDLSYSEIHVVLGVYAAVLYMHFGARLLKNTGRDSVMEEIKELAQEKAASLSVPVESSVDYVQIHEEALAAFAQKIRNLEGKAEENLYATLISGISLGAEGIAQEIPVEGSSMLSVSGTLLCDPADPGAERAALALAQVDGADVPLSGFAKSDVGWFRYLSGVPSGQFSFELAIPAGARVIQMKYRTWSALMPCFLLSLPKITLS